MGVNLFTLRFVAILGVIGIGAILYVVTREKTVSKWWGLIAVGLFACAYRVMDVYLDTAHSDSWMVFSALLGSYIIDKNRSTKWNVFGIVLLVASFWFKQHGALFAIGGVLYLTHMHGFKNSLVYSITALVLGPILYIFAGQFIFGSHFHFFTWEVPRQWSTFNASGIVKRFSKFLLAYYPIFALTGGYLWLNSIKAKIRDINIWYIQFVFALCTGILGTFDPGSSDNVFIPMGTFLILFGTLGIYWLTKVRWIIQYRLHFLALFISFALFLYNPLKVTVSTKAHDSYKELTELLRSKNGYTYAPSLGQLQDGYRFHPSGHWVALEDMIRGPGKDTQNHPNTHRLLQPLLVPEQPSYILANYPLNEMYSWLEFLDDYYTLESDFGERFESLRVIPKRYDHGYPRYFYKFSPSKSKFVNLNYQK